MQATPPCMGEIFVLSLSFIKKSRYINAFFFFFNRICMNRTTLWASIQAAQLFPSVNTRYPFAEGKDFCLSLCKVIILNFYLNYLEFVHYFAVYCDSNASLQPQEGSKSSNSWISLEKERKKTNN